MREITATGNSLYFVHTDHLGSISAVTSVTGTVVARQYYLPFGGTRPGGTGSMPTDKAFTGQRLDGTGLMFYQARYYSSALGRFVSADTIVPGAGNPQNLNRYAYVHSNPIRYTDPTGHVCTDASGENAMPGNCQGNPAQRVSNASGQGLHGRGTPAQEAVSAYCRTAICSGPNIDYVSVNLGFAGNLSSSAFGRVALPYHSDIYSRAGYYYEHPELLFPWEGMALVTYAEHRQLHPDFNSANDREYLLRQWMGDAVGIMQTMINRAQSRRYSSANDAALTRDQYVYIVQPDSINERAFTQFYGLAFLVGALPVRVDQPCEYFVHQDLNAHRGIDPTGDINSAGVSYATTDTTAFGPDWT